MKRSVFRVSDILYIVDVNKESILEGLNERQKSAVLASDGPILIVAGAGSGKTKTLTHKVAHLIASGIKPEAIVALTFTNKAADEMKRRVFSLLEIEEGSTRRTPFIGTFHKFALRMVRQHAKDLGYESGLSVYDESEALSVMRAAVKEAWPDQNQPDLAARTLSALSRIRNGKDIADKGTDAIPPALRRVSAIYESLLKRKNAIDFDNIILQALTLVRTRPDIKAWYQERLTHFLIDEFQDTNAPQYALVTELAQAKRNICVVGDDWQSIYSFRCADFTHLLRFEQQWPGTRVFFLEQNYRSTQTILDASHGVIARNTFRTEKKLFTNNSAGTLITIARLQDERMEAWWVMEQIQERIRNGMMLKDCAVLFRTNVQSRTLEELCMERGVPYQIIGAYRFYQRREIQDVLAYLKYLANPKDSVSLERIINVPRRGIGQTAVDELRNSSWDPALAAARLSGRLRPAMQKFAESIALFRALAQSVSLSELMETVVSRIEYKEYCDPSTDEGTQRWENVQELIGIAKEYGQDPADKTLERFLENAQLVQDTDSLKQSANMLTLMTLHGAKGLEFPCVFIVGVEENILPHERSLRSQTDIEEERRLLYVGMTRAKQDLSLTCAHHRFLHGEYSMNAPSRFIDDIPEELTQHIDQTMGQDLYDSERTIYL